MDMLTELKRALKIISGSVLIGLVLYGYRNWLGSSDTFQIRDIEISGIEILSVEEIYSLADIVTGKRIWEVDLSEAEEGIRSNPFVAGVTIRRDFPDILRITIQEKEALALLKANKKFFAIDKAGLVLPKPGRLYDMPVISGNINESLQIGKTIEHSDVEAGLELLTLIKEDGSGLYKEISEIVPGRREGMVLYTSQKSIPVYMGEADYTAKIRYLEAVLKDLGNQLSGIRYIDLRFRGQVILGKRT